MTVALATSLAAEPPIAVSPGSPVVAEAVANRCPTFSWSGVTGATGYELELYEVGADGSLRAALQTRVPGDARAWTPPAAACPAAGLRYAWTVRAATAEGAWVSSEPLLFSTPGAPTEDEVRRALETLRLYRNSAFREGVDLLDASADREVDSWPTEDVEGAPPRLGLRMPEAGRTPAVAPRPGDVPLGAPLTASTVGYSPGSRDISAPGDYALSLDGDIGLGGAVFREGYPFLHNDGGAAYDNVGLGLEALVSLTPGVPETDSGSENTGVGNEALKNNTSGQQNTAVGNEALRNTSTGTVNAAVGSRALRNNTSGFSNTAVGDRAARSNTTGAYNTAVGRAALYSATNASDNTAVGYRALVATTSSRNSAVGSLALTSSTEGSSNTAMGFRALYGNTIGNYNTAVGNFALSMNTIGALNTALGALALDHNTSGNLNTAVGDSAMRNVSTGSYNTALGQAAGSGWTTGSFNIAIGTNVGGSASDSGVIRIGHSSATQTYITGIHDATVSGGAQVFVDSLGQLGTLTSSARFKREVHELEEIGDRLLVLRPVSFRYKEEIVDRELHEAPLEYGLIAEEVAEVFPELVIYDEEGEPYAVRYHLLAPLLLAEVQQLNKVLQTTRKEVEMLRGRGHRSLRLRGAAGRRPVR